MICIYICYLTIHYTFFLFWIDDVGLGFAPDHIHLCHTVYVSTWYNSSYDVCSYRDKNWREKGTLFSSRKTLTPKACCQETRSWQELYSYNTSRPLFLFSLSPSQHNVRYALPFSCHNIPSTILSYKTFFFYRYKLRTSLLLLLHLHFLLPLNLRLYTT